MIDTLCCQVADCAIRAMTVEIDPGPASMGTPSGMMPTSSFSMACWVSDAVSLVCDRRACTMSSPMRIMINPPAMRNAGRVIPNLSLIHI